MTVGGATTATSATAGFSSPQQYVAWLEEQLCKYKPLLPAAAVSGVEAVQAGAGRHAPYVPGPGAASADTSMKHQRDTDALAGITRRALGSGRQARSSDVPGAPLRTSRPNLPALMPPPLGQTNRPHVEDDTRTSRAPPSPPDARDRSREQQDALSSSNKHGRGDRRQNTFGCPPPHGDHYGGQGRRRYKTPPPGDFHDGRSRWHPVSPPPDTRRDNSGRRVGASTPPTAGNKQYYRWPDTSFPPRVAFGVHYPRDRGADSPAPSSVGEMDGNAVDPRIVVTSSQFLVTVVVSELSTDNKKVFVDSRAGGSYETGRGSARGS